MQDPGGAALDRLGTKLASLARGRVLDVGCGEGRFLPSRGIGIDVDGARLRAARARSPLVVRADARAIPFADRSFDTVYALRMLNDTGDVGRTLAEIARVMRDDASLVVFTRARTAEGDRLDRANGAARLRRHFADVHADLPEDDDRAALFIAARPLR